MGRKIDDNFNSLKSFHVEHDFYAVWFYFYIFLLIMFSEIHCDGRNAIRISPRGPQIQKTGIDRSLQQALQWKPSDSQYRGL